jgi:hypothetical protein
MITTRDLGGLGPPDSICGAIYTIELQMRGIFESEEYPPQFDSMTKILESRRQGAKGLDGDTIDMFKECLLVSGNEATIQTDVCFLSLSLSLSLSLFFLVLINFLSSTISPAATKVSNTNNSDMPLPNLTMLVTAY